MQHEVLAGHGPKIVLPHVDDGIHALDDIYSSVVIAKSEPVGAGLPNAMLSANPIDRIIVQQANCKKSRVVGPSTV